MKNCENCRHLEWFSGEDSDPSGYICNGRGEYKTSKEESKHLEQLKSEKYRKRGKVCHEHHDNFDIPGYGHM